ncbi:MAG TPA: hypothetical protein VH950_15935 [Gaiellaceae bacterium]
MALVAVVAAALSLVAAAAADDGHDEGERRVRCSGGSEARLRVRARDGVLSVELELRPARAGRTWRVIVLHERRTAARSVIRLGSGGRLRRQLPDWLGTDTVAARATAAAGEACRVAVTVRGR